MALTPEQLAEIQRLKELMRQPATDAQRKAQAAWNAEQMSKKSKGGSIKDLEAYIRQRHGESGANRVQRAADEIPNLENMFHEKALRDAFDDKKTALMSMNPADFEKYATPLSSWHTDPESTRHTRESKKLNFEEYLEHLAKIKGFDSVPYLDLFKSQYLPFPNMAGHEGRHRNRALAKKGIDKSLVQLKPAYEYRKGLPNETQEEFLAALQNKLGRKPFVLPQNTMDGETRRQIELPDYYANGGNVSTDAMRYALTMKPKHMAYGGPMRNYAPGAERHLKKYVGNVKYPSPEKQIEILKDRILKHPNLSDEAVQRVKEELARQEHQLSVNNWIDSVAHNYIKKQMGTENDPVRLQAESGITHVPLPEDGGYFERKGETRRKVSGGKQMAKSDEARTWENRTDAMLEAEDAQAHQDMMHLSPGMYSESDQWVKKLDPKAKLWNFTEHFDARDLGLDHIRDVLHEDLMNGRIRPEQLNKISMAQAVKRVHEYDQEARKKREEAIIKQTEGMPTVHEYPEEGMKWIELAMPKGEAALSDLGKKIMEKHRQEGTEPSAGVLEKAMQEGGREKLAAALKYEGEAMGHCVGGYCPDVEAGRSRIFSLRDKKGEPHVTIETAPAQGRSNYEDMSRIYDQANQEANDKNFNTSAERNNFYHERVKQLQMDMLDKQVADMPHRIVQIKGKGNAKPHKKYIPHVQHFVKSGNWSDVGDLMNTDLHMGQQKFNPVEHEMMQQAGHQIPKFMSDDELKQLMSVRSKLPDPEESVAVKPIHKAQGGNLKQSTDDMKREMMSKGKAPAGYRHHTHINPDPHVGTRYKTEFLGGLAPEVEIEPESLLGASFGISPWDTSSKNVKIHEVSGRPLMTEPVTSGGQHYARDLANIAAGRGGASGERVVKGQQARINEAYKENIKRGGTGRIITSPSTMAKNSTAFSTMPLEIQVDLLHQSGIHPDQYDELDRLARATKGTKNFVGFQSPHFWEQITQGGHGLKTTPGNLRKHLSMKVLGSKQGQQMLNYNLEDVMNAVDDPELLGAPKGMTGRVLLEGKPNQEYMLDPAHESYSTGHRQDYIGRSTHAPAPLWAAEAYKKIEANFLRKNPELAKNPNKLREWTLNTLAWQKKNAYQPIDKQIVTNLERFRQAVADNQFSASDIPEAMKFFKKTHGTMTNPHGYADGGPVDISETGVNEAPNLSVKAYSPFALDEDGSNPFGGVDLNQQQPGKQLMPQQQQQPQQPPMPVGAAPAPAGLSNILQMTPQGQAMAAMRPTQPPAKPAGMKRGGKVTMPSTDAMRYALTVKRNKAK